MTYVATSSPPIVGSILSLYKAGSNFLYRAGQMNVQALEAAFYHQVGSASRRTNDFTRSISEFATNHFLGFQQAFMCVDGLMLLNSARQFTHLIDHPIMGFASQTFMGNFLPAISLALAMGFSSYFIVSKTMNIKGKSTARKLSTSLQIVNTINSIALSVLTKQTSLFFGALFNAYSLYKNNKIEWLVMRGEKNLDRATDLHSVVLKLQSPIRKIETLYSVLLLKKGSTKNDNCTICLDVEPDSEFCSNGHLFHRGCLKDYIIGNNKSFYEKLKFKKIENIKKDERYYTYEVDIPEANLPICPQCRELPPQHKLDISVYDIKTKQQHRAEVNIVREEPPQSNQRRFEKVNAFYNVFQAGLATLQQIPEFAPAITTLRHYLIVTDVLSAAATQFYLTKNIGPEKKHWLYTTLPLAAISLPSFTYLKEIFSYSKDLTYLVPYGISARFETPTFVSIHQLINTYRLVSTVGLSYFSKAHKAFNITSILSQVLGLGASMRLPWLRVDQAGLREPINDFYSPSFQSYSIVSSSTANDDPLLRKAISSIFHLQNKFLSSLSKRVHLRTNSDYNRSIDLFYRLKKVYNLSEYVTKPFHWWSEGWVTHRTFGGFRLNVKAGSQIPFLF